MSGELKLAEVQEVSVIVDPVEDPEDLDMDDRRHARWLHPIVPEGGGKGDLEVELEKKGFSPDEVMDTLLRFDGYFVSRYLAKDGLYGIGTSPQYAIRRDYQRLTLEEMVSSLIVLLGSR